MLSAALRQLRITRGVYRRADSRRTYTARLLLNLFVEGTLASKTSCPVDEALRTPLADVLIERVHRNLNHLT